MAKEVKVCIPHPRKDAVIELCLDRKTKIGDLTAILYEKKFLEWQKPGYRYLSKGHLLAETHNLDDYMDKKENEITITVFDVPTIMV